MSATMDARTVARTQWPRLTEADLDLYMRECERRGVDPTARLIVPRPNLRKREDGGGYDRVGPPSWIVTIDYMRIRADETDAYAPGSATIYETTEGGALVAATAFVRKLVQGTWIETGETAYWAEYGSQDAMWRKMPRVMLAKVAEARALRRAFPKALAGLYSEEEMDQAGPREPANGETIEEHGKRLCARLQEMPHPAAVRAWAHKHAAEIKARGEEFAAWMHARVEERLAELAPSTPSPEAP